MICNGAPIPVPVAEYIEFWNRYFEMQRDMLTLMNDQLPIAYNWMQLYIDVLNTMVPKK